MMIQSSNPIRAAQQLHAYLGWTQPQDFTLDEIANSLGIGVRNIPIEGSDGRISINGNTAIISIKDSITNIGRRNFILGHEIGHFLLHKDSSALFSDTDMTLSEWHKKGPHEQQANEFASELLMPSELFKAKVKGKKLDIVLMERISDYFQTSRLAAFIRYASLGEFPVMVVFMRDGLIKWKQYSHDFPFTYLPKDSRVPVLTVAGDYFYNKVVEQRPEKIDAIEWFPEDYGIKHKEDWKLWEQCYPVGDNCLVSCLWTD